MEALITSFPSLSVSLSLSIFDFLSGLRNRCELCCHMAFSRCTDSRVFFSEREKEQTEQRGRGTGEQMWVQPHHKLLRWRVGGRQWHVLFWKIMGGVGGIGVMLHKLSSRSACTARPTVQRDEWNVGQTPPPLFLSPSVSFFFSYTVMWIFGKQKQLCGVGYQPLFCLSLCCLSICSGVTIVLLMAY